MKNELLVYIPSETKAAPHISMKRILGVPQFLRPILTLEEEGLRGVIVVAPVSERRRIIKAWKRHTAGKEIVPHFIWTPNNQKINAKILDNIIRNSRENLILLNANLLIGKTLLDPWRDVKLRDGQHLEAYIDRGLPPLVGVARSDLENMLLVVEESPITVEELIKRILERTRPHPASYRWHEPVKLLTRFTTRREATKYLTEKIRLSTPTWIAKNINKRISLPISVALARMRVSPNAITVFNMLVGMGASVGAAGRTYVGLLFGAILFQLASIIDGCDGEVAKLTHRCSKFGQYIDSISDNFALAGFITGLMIHVYRVNNHTPMAFVWGGLLLVGFGIILAFMINFLKKNTDSASFVTFDKEFLQKLPDAYPRPLLLFIKYAKYTMKKDFFSLLFLIFAVIGILPVMFYISIFGTWLCVLILAYLNFKPVTSKKEIKRPVEGSV